MKKIYSLASPQHFDYVLNKGKKIRSKYFLISFINDKDFQVGISIPKKLGNAVFRNKQKRQVRNIIDSSNIYHHHLHFVVIVKRPFTDLNFEQKTKIFNQEFKKII